MAKAVSAVDPSGPPPEDDPAEWPASLGDLRRVVDDLNWPWPGWLASGVLNVLASRSGMRENDPLRLAGPPLVVSRTLA